MKTGHDSLAVRLVDDIFGPATGDPLEDALRRAARIGAARLGEMIQTGFDTDTPFDQINQAQYVGEGRKGFLLVSCGTGTTYFVQVIKVDAEIRVAIAVHQKGTTPKAENLRRMTLVPNRDGNVRAIPGW